MGDACQALLLLFMCMPISYAQDFLQNPDFEIPPTNINITSNASSRTLLQGGANSIPGWSFKGTVWYLSSGALQLGGKGEINQTIRAVEDDVNDYILSFSVAALTQGCIDDGVSVNVSVYMRLDVRRRRQFILQRNYSRNLWERRALYVGQLVGGQSVDIQITGDVGDNNVTNCWPVVDDFVVNRINVYGNPTNVRNGDFELGSALLNNSSEGIILNGEEDMYQSPLQRWSILGTIKYIDSQHGNAAIELLSGAPSGIRKEFLDPPTPSTLSFTIGDANDSCVGDFIIYVEAGADKFNFSLESLGRGSSVNHSVPVSSLSSTLNVLTFYTMNETKTSDGVLCGPVLDNIRLISHGQRRQVYEGGLLIFSLFFALMLLC